MMKNMNIDKIVVFIFTIFLLIGLFAGWWQRLETIIREPANVVSIIEPNCEYCPNCGIKIMNTNE